MQSAAEQRRQAFSFWLRTGRVLGHDGLRHERKFNPWHDTRTGRFTFAGAGQYFAAGSAGSPGAQRQTTPSIIFKEDPAKPPFNTDQDVDVWVAALSAKHGNKRGFPEAIKAQGQRYKQNLREKELAANPPGDVLTKLADFAGGFGEGVYDVGKGVATGLYSLATTNPVTSVQNIEFGIARSIDDAITAEDTPAHTQLRRATRAVANASAHDLGHAAGSFSGNVGLALAPATVAARISTVRRIAKARVGAGERARSRTKARAKAKARIGAALSRIRWVDETPIRKGVAKDYNDSAMGARSNVVTRRSEVPALEWRLPNGGKRQVRFDGLDGKYLVDRKWSIYTSAKTKNQALSQSVALRQNGLTAIWEVPTEYQKRRALKLLYKLGISNIHVEVVKPSWNK